MEVCSSTEMGAPGASHLGTGDHGPKTDRSRPRSVPGKRRCGYLEGWPPGFPAKRNHACSRLVLRLARRNGSVRCGRVCSKIVYSVRVGPPQLNFFCIKNFGHPATIRILRSHAASQSHERLPGDELCQNCVKTLSVLDIGVSFERKADSPNC
jgi:hypothetical protein